jgi:lipoprotein NlpI
LYYDSGEYRNAAAELKRICEQDTEDDYSHFYLWLARARLSQQDEATAELRQYLKKRSNGTTNDWASEIGLFLTEQLPESDFIEAADRTDQAKVKGQQCEAFFYAGSKRLLMGDREMAAQYFEKCKATGQTAFTEYQSALAELERVRIPP